ncbi:hypothetical protein Agub_g860, partial [Astrephomene gubernaculifera]
DLSAAAAPPPMLLAERQWPAPSPPSQPPPAAAVAAAPRHAASAAAATAPSGNLIASSTTTSSLLASGMGPKCVAKCASATMLASCADDAVVGDADAARTVTTATATTAPTGGVSTGEGCIVEGVTGGGGGGDDMVTSMRDNLDVWVNSFWEMLRESRAWQGNTPRSYADDDLRFLRLVRRLGSGGAASVFAGMLLGQDVAVKVIHPPPDVDMAALAAARSSLLPLLPSTASPPAAADAAAYSAFSAAGAAPVLPGKTLPASSSPHPQQQPQQSSEPSSSIPSCAPSSKMSAVGSSLYLEREQSATPPRSRGNNTRP